MDGPATQTFPIDGNWPALSGERWDYLFQAELRHARSKFPDSQKMLAALVEEVGELAKALLENPGSGDVLKEALQVAVMACRLGTEGDKSLGHRPSVEHYREYKMPSRQGAAQ